MEMKENEIVARYSQNPSRQTIKILAELNDCALYSIESVLKKHGIEVPEKSKAGRPPKKAQDQNLPSIEASKKDDSEESKIKCDSHETIKQLDVNIKPVIERPVPKYLIPSQVQQMTKERIEAIQRQIMYLCDKVDELNAEKHELETFLKGEWAEDGKENKLLRKI